MKLKFLQEDPYADIICRFLSQTYHKAIVPNAKQLLEILTLILVGDKDIRLGPIPSPESLVVIRKTITSAIELNLPIPILVAWGGRKANGDKGVDVAEMAGLHQLMRLQENIRKYHAPGVIINIRIEDMGADWLYRSERKDIFDVVEKYSSEFTDMVNTLTVGYDITPIRESSLMVDRSKYFAISKDYSCHLEKVIMQRLNDGMDKDLSQLPSWQQLEAKGWKGSVPLEQINYYIGLYEKLNPGLAQQDYARMLADYLGGAKARYIMNGRAEPKTDVGSFVGISFVPPIPGAPAGMFSNTLYYRTVPQSDGKTHIAPWRAKGYLSIDVDNSVKMKVTSWGNTEFIESLTPATVQIDDRLTIDTDYVAKDFVMPLFV